MADEVNVTPDMIEAGADVCRTYVDREWEAFDNEFQTMLLSKIYQAMAAANRSIERPNTNEVDC